MTTQTINDTEQTPDVFGGIIEAFRRDGFDQGYQRAGHDLLAAMVYNAEIFLREHPGREQELRKVLYSFVARLERQIDRSIERHSYYEGGLGI